MKRLVYLSAAIGLLVLTALVLYQGLPGIMATLQRAGWPLLWLVPAHIVPLACDTQAWRMLLEPSTRSERAGFPFLLWVAAVREAVARLLPSVGVGGEVVGIHLARMRLNDTAAISASVVLEVLITISVLYLFSAVGIVLMAHIAAGMSQVWVIATSLAVSLPLPVGAWWLLRHGALFERLQRWLTPLLGPQNRIALQLDGARLDAEIGKLFAQPARLARACAWQLAGYLIGSLENWVALYLLGHPVSIEAAVAVEALTQAVRHASFLIPAGLGVQEAAVLLFGYLAGINGDLALSLALVKRMREILFGVPALLSWQWLVARRWHLQRKAG
jgi:putative membrane protein